MTCTLEWRRTLEWTPTVERFRPLKQRQRTQPTSPKATGLLHGEERLVFSNAGYKGIEKPVDEITKHPATWHVAIRPSKRNALGKTSWEQITRLLERLKYTDRACMEHPLHYIKNVFGLMKLRYKGLAMNTAQLCTLLARADLLIAKKRREALNAEDAYWLGEKDQKGQYSGHMNPEKRQFESKPKSKLNKKFSRDFRMLKILNLWII